MAFAQRLRDIDLVTPSLSGMASSRKELWRKTLEDCKSEFEKRGLSASVNATAAASLNSLLEKSTAVNEGPAALSVYRYVGEGLTRSVLSMAYEYLLPFEWSCNWSAAAMQKVMIRISSFLAPMTLHRKSRLLPSFPISVLGSIIDLMTSREAENLNWWAEQGNLKAVMKKAKRMAKGFSGLHVWYQDKKLIDAPVLAFAEGVKALEVISGAKDFATLQRDAASYVDSIMSGIYQNDRDSNCTPSFLFGKEKILSVWHMILDIDVAVGCEMGFFIDVQLAYLNIRQDCSLTNTYRSIVTGNGKGRSIARMMSLDNFLLDIAHLCSDMYNTMTLLSSKENEEHVGHVMTVLAEPWDEYKECNYRKLFMLCVALMKGVEAEKVDNNLLINAIVEKLDDNGKLSSLRKKRSKLTSRQSKRAPKLQPRVIYSRSLSDSEDDYCARKHSSKRRAKRKGRKKNKRQNVGTSSSGSEGDSQTHRNETGNASIPVTSSQLQSTQTQHNSSPTEQGQPQTRKSRERAPPPKPSQQNQRSRSPVPEARTPSTLLGSEEDTRSNSEALIAEVGLDGSTNDENSPIRPKKTRTEVGGILSEDISTSIQPNIQHDESSRDLDEDANSQFVGSRSVRRSTRVRKPVKKQL